MMARNDDPRAIKRLDESVINRIAAGEVILRPSQAVKELVENSLDAHATLIQITAKDGGLKYLSVQDNGCGIPRESLDIVCERFTTSKLDAFEDLRKIRTFGFRGEALASLSYVGAVTITSKTKAQDCAYTAQYVDGKPKKSAKPCAGTNGTSVIVENIFYSTPTRLKAFKNLSDEYHRILQIIERYAIHYPHVRIICRKKGNAMPDLASPGNGDRLAAIRMVFGVSLSKELVEFERSGEGCDSHALITHTSYHLKRSIFVLFINGRLVESSRIKKAIEGVYERYIPKKNYPFVYLSLDVDPATVDVNVHPTKKEVILLNEGSIIDMITEEIETRLIHAQTSKTYIAATIPAKSLEKTPTTQGSQVYEHYMVRTDSRDQTLKSLWSSKSKGSSQSQDPGSWDSTQRSQFSCPESGDGEFRADKMTTQVVKSHVYVGSVDPSRCFVQYDTGLYLIDVLSISIEVFRHSISVDMMDLTVLGLETKALLKDALDDDERSGYSAAEMIPKEQIIDGILAQIWERRDWISPFVRLGRDGNQVTHIATPTLPFVLEPSRQHLPFFFLRLGSEVDWSDEASAVRDTRLEVATLFAWSLTNEIVEENLLPYWKTARGFAVPKSAQAEAIRVANLPDLYKVFERC